MDMLNKTKPTLQKRGGNVRRQPHKGSGDFLKYGKSKSDGCSVNSFSTDFCCDNNDRLSRGLRTKVHSAKKRAKGRYFVCLHPDRCRTRNLCEMRNVFCSEMDKVHSHMRNLERRLERVLNGSMESVMDGAVQRMTIAMEKADIFWDTKDKETMEVEGILAVSKMYFEELKADVKELRDL